MMQAKPILAAPVVRLSFPVGRKNDIVGLIDQFRSFSISESEVYSKLRGMGFSNASALEYLELVTSTRTGLTAC